MTTKAESVLDSLADNNLIARVRSNSLTSMDEHPILSTLVVALAAIITIPIIVLAILVVLVTSSSVCLALLVPTSFILVPAILVGASAWLCYVASRWALGLVLRGTVGSGNRAVVRPQASAMGNEAHGNLEINLVKVDQKDGAQPDQVS